jgi:uncharacterized protein (DUF1501 family)
MRSTDEPAEDLDGGAMSPKPTRRTFLKGSAAVAGAAALASSGSVTLDLLSAPAAHGATPPGRLVVVFLRGGQDHLSTVVPYTESAYYAARPTIAIPAAEVLQLDSRFGFHPAMVQLHNLYQSGRLAVVAGAGNLAGSRSHFSAQDLWEAGTTAPPSDSSGWLARYLNGTSTSSDALFRGLTLGDNVNASLRGYPALSIAEINEFGLGGLTDTNAGLTDLIRDEYLGNAVVEQTGTRALDAAAKVGTLSGSTATDPVTRAFADLAGGARRSGFDARCVPGRPRRPRDHRRHHRDHDRVRAPGRGERQRRHRPRVRLRDAGNGRTGERWPRLRQLGRVGTRGDRRPR